MGWIVQGLNHGRSKWFLSSPNHPDWPWNLPSFLFSWYHRSFLEIKHGGMMLITHLYLVMRLRMTGVLPQLLSYAFMAWMMTTLPCNVTNTVHHHTSIRDVIVCGFKDLESHPSSGAGVFLILAMHAEILGKSYPPLCIRGCFCGRKAVRVYTVYDNFPSSDH